MKAFSLVCVLLGVFSGHLAMAAPELPGPPAPPEQKPPPEWKVRVEVLMIAMPQAMFLKHLPDLHDPSKIDDAVDQLLGATQRKEAIITGYPTVSLLDGDRSVTETILEKRYPTEFELPPPNSPKGGTSAPPPGPDSLLISSNGIPTSFETRNTGVTLEVEAKVESGGESIMLNLVPQRVDLLSFDVYESVKTVSGKITKVDQPQFLVSKTTTRVVVKNGQRTLIGVHSLPKPENYMEVFILQAVASPVPGKGKPQQKAGAVDRP
jgi:hypothetical protein